MLITLFQTSEPIQKSLKLKRVKFKPNLKFGLTDSPDKLERSKLLPKSLRMPKTTDKLLKKHRERLMLPLPPPLLLKLMLRPLKKEQSPTTSRI